MQEKVKARLRELAPGGQREPGFTQPSVYLLADVRTTCSATDQVWTSGRNQLFILWRAYMAEEILWLASGIYRLQPRNRGGGGGGAQRACNPRSVEKRGPEQNRGPINV